MLGGLKGPRMLLRWRTSAIPRNCGNGVRSNLAIASLLQARPGMPDPEPARATFANLLERLEAP